MNIKRFSENPDPKAVNQVYELAAVKAFEDAQIRVMSDIHVGNGCVIGFTANLGDKVIPNVVGVDIGCGMLTAEIGKKEINFEALDRFIKQNIPSGFSMRNKVHSYLSDVNIKSMKMYDELRNMNRIEKSLGTLGGGNHFIEIAIDEDKNKMQYLIIHSGSRNLGLQVAKYYQKLAKDYHLKGGEQYLADRKKLVTKLTDKGRQAEIGDMLKTLNKPKVPVELAYLEGQLREDYLHDMRIAQNYATFNRAAMAADIMTYLNVRNCGLFQTIHNYIDEKNMVRKGAISAHKNELVLIPLNMRDGSLLCIGKGNSDWNYSAPHGAGRIMARGQAKRELDMDEFTETMKKVYTSSVMESTLDEAPMAYKPAQEIIDAIGDTVKIIARLKPIYNFKAH